MQTMREFAKLMDTSKESKNKIVDYISGSKLRILDFGAGSGAISIQIAEKFPDSEVFAYDINDEMIGVIESKVSHLHNIKVVKEIPESGFDYVILSSVMHEIIADGEFEKMMKKFSELLKENGKLLIRDGLAPSKDSTMKVKIVDHGYFNHFITAVYDEVLVSKNPKPNLMLELTTGIKMDLNQTIVGSEWELKNLINKATWGTKSLHREAYELFLVQNKNTFKDLKGWELIDFKEFVDKSYFEYVRKVFEIEKEWETHFIAVLRKL